MYLISFANEIQADPTRRTSNNPLHVKGTGGSETKKETEGKKKSGFVQLLQMFIRETRDPDAEKGASPKGGDMQCPLTSAKKYLRGPRFTKQVCCLQCS